MTIHPIRALDHVIAEYRDYLRSEFRARDEGLRKALEEQLDAPMFLSQEPFFSAHRPFAVGNKWRDLPLNPRLADAMVARARGRGAKDPERAFLHQSDAIERLLGAAPGPLVVATGTGSGKTESFLLPVIENAIRDAGATGGRPGLTAILLYPMNALANDQFERLGDYLSASGFAGCIDVARYDQTTKNEERERMRRTPPRVLLTNYVMLDYLLLREADREALFRDHRCRFLVLDEVHTYRGSLGANVALLVRRVREHLRRHASQTGAAYDLITVGTSATVKGGGVGAQATSSVAEFFGTLAGVRAEDVRVIGETLAPVVAPAEATYSPMPARVAATKLEDVAALKAQLEALAGGAPAASLAAAAQRCRVLWDLNALLTGAPHSVSQLVGLIKAKDPQRRDVPDAAVTAEIEAALAVGAALPDDIPGALRLRAHRLVRGGWQFHRCIDAACGKIFPKGEETCDACGAPTAPLFLCRSCGADYLRFREVGAAGDESSADEADGSDDLLLEPNSARPTDGEYLLVDAAKFGLEELDDEDGEEEERGDEAAPVRRGRGADRTSVRKGYFDAVSGAFSTTASAAARAVQLTEKRTRCLVCGSRAGSRSILTPIALGTSAAVKTLAEATTEGLAEQRPVPARGAPPQKEQLLIFSDSRQDASHQARFIIQAARYDRMRRRVVAFLKEQPQGASIQRVVEELGAAAVIAGDNPRYVVRSSAGPRGEERDRIRAWEEAPLLDDLALSAGYRNTMVNLGLVALDFDGLHDLAQSDHGRTFAARLGVDSGTLEHVLRCCLLEILRDGALSRELLQFHPRASSCPRTVTEAEWERKLPRPTGLPISGDGKAAEWKDQSEIVEGVRVLNPCKKPNENRGRAPRLQLLTLKLLGRTGRSPADAAADRKDALAVVEFLRDQRFLKPVDLRGFTRPERLLQIDDGLVRLVLTKEAIRRRCTDCRTPHMFSALGAPCRRCDGRVVAWTDAQVYEARAARRIVEGRARPLQAAEHTAQVPSTARAEIEDRFKSATDPLNVLACSPTLEMGIDVGGLDAVLLRNVPPRPDNYAQRGGRAGRQGRVGLVVSYARNTPHDQYFFEKPEEMIAGEIATPLIATANRDVLLRHINAIAFGLLHPTLSGRMFDYVKTDGSIAEETVGPLLEGLKVVADKAAVVAKQTFGAELLQAAGFDDGALGKALAAVPHLARGVFERTARQVVELRKPVQRHAETLEGSAASTHAGRMIKRLLGLPDDDASGRDADHRSSGYPLRRFAEFGILPGYEFPSEPATVRLLNDPNEEDTVAVARRFGLVQFQPDAPVFARGRRWKVLGIDRASPWNPPPNERGVAYRVCTECEARIDGQSPRCRRCGHEEASEALTGMEYGGFVARRDEAPVLDEEDRFAASDRLRVEPQWNGDVVRRWTTAAGWSMRLSKRESVWFINEGPPPTETSSFKLHEGACGFLLCRACGAQLTPPSPKAATRNQTATASVPTGHLRNCPGANALTRPVALLCRLPVETLRIIVPAPEGASSDDLRSRFLSLGYALRAGIRRRYMLDGPEIEFLLEGPWTETKNEERTSSMSLTFYDATLGGTGYLERIGDGIHEAARAAIEHLDHEGCETACYRCLKSYQNQRLHGLLNWPLAHPYLEALAAAPPERRKLEARDIDGPKPWLEAYAARVGSPLELRFLRLFEQHGFHPEKQTPIFDGPKKFPMTVADFAVPDRRLAIYVDGASIHVGHVSRRDARIRERLRSMMPPWRVEVLRAEDLQQGKSLVERLKHE